MEMLKYQNTNSQVPVHTYSSHSPLLNAPAEVSKWQLAHWPILGYFTSGSEFSLFLNEF